MEFERLKQIMDDARRPGVRAALALFLNGPRYVGELLVHLDETIQRLEREKEILRQDNTTLDGRKSVEVEAAAREGWRQAVQSVRPGNITEKDLALDLELVRDVARKAQPRPVYGEAALRAGVPDGVTVVLQGGTNP
jgi:hypothetical protein